MRSFYEFARSENPAGGAASQRIIFHGEKRFLATQGGGDDEFIIFGVTGWGVFGRGI
jgi:hypothetical protein